MTLIGMLHHRKDPKTVIKSYAYAAVAKAEGANFVYFSPKMVNVEDRTITGLVMENGQWVQQTTPLPDVILNDGSPVRLNKAKDVLEALKKEGIPFTTHSIGNKWSVYRRIKNSHKLVQYLIPSEKIKSHQAFHFFITAFQEIVIKPTDGRKGQGIYFVKKLEEGFEITQDQTASVLSPKEMDHQLTSWIQHGAYIMQPYISSKTQSGQVFDLRLHAQKNGEGKWTITTIYPRIAPKGTIVTNINNGGYTNYLEPFLKQEFPENAFDIQRTLEQFTLALAEHLDELQMSHFEEVIDEIGIDVGIDDNQKLWIYEVNWRPGCPPAFYLEMDVVINDIQYAMYLANHQDEIQQKIEAVKQKNKMEIRNRPVIAVTGSAGKTTTKAFLASILSKRWHTFESKDYWNTTEHTKKHAERFDDTYQAAVLEYAMAYPGVITEHCRILKPNRSIITNIGMAHIANFDGDIRGIAHAKSELIHGMDQNGVLVVNQDDDNSRMLETEDFKGRILTIGIRKEADYQAYDVRYVKHGMTFKVKLLNKPYQFFIPIVGEHHIYNALNAIALADDLGFTPIEMIWGLIFEKPEQRMTIYELKKNIRVIDDTVHAQPQAVKAALDVLKEISHKRKIAVLGQMRELGDLLEEQYLKVGRHASDLSVDYLLTYGSRAEKMGEGAIAAGYPENRYQHFDTKEALNAFLSEILQEGDTVLVKGASRIRMVDFVDFLRKTLGEEA